MTTKKGGRPATGYVKCRRNPKRGGRMQWYVQLTVANAKRTPFIELDPGIEQHDRAGALACARRLSDEARASGMVPESIKETVAEYASRWLEPARAASTASGTIAGDA